MRKIVLPQGPAKCVLFYRTSVTVEQARMGKGAPYCYGKCESQKGPAKDVRSSSLSYLVSSAASIRDLRLFQQLSYGFESHSESKPQDELFLPQGQGRRIGRSSTTLERRQSGSVRIDSLRSERECRTPTFACHAGGRGFESRRSRHSSSELANIRTSGRIQI